MTSAESDTFDQRLDVTHVRVVALYNGVTCAGRAWPVDEVTMPYSEFSDAEIEQMLGCAELDVTLICED